MSTSATTGAERREWVDTKDKTRGLLRRLGFRSATHRRERFWDADRPEPEKETARGYEITRQTLDDPLARYSIVMQPSPPSHPNGRTTAWIFISPSPGNTMMDGKSSISLHGEKDLEACDGGLRIDDLERLFGPRANSAMAASPLGGALEDGSPTERC